MCSWQKLCYFQSGAWKVFVFSRYSLASIVNSSFLRLTWIINFPTVIWGYQRSPINRHRNVFVSQTLQSKVQRKKESPVVAKLAEHLFLFYCDFIRERMMYLIGNQEKWLWCGTQGTDDATNLAANWIPALPWHASAIDIPKGFQGSANRCLCS